MHMNWLDYFRHNRDHRMHIPWEQGIQIEAHLREPLIRSLQRFKVGESGEGIHLRKRAATAGNCDYEATIDLFINEEQEHARLMGCVLKRLNAPLLSKHWSDSCFVALRHFFGLHGTLLVLLMPEMIAKCYFLALREGTSDPVLNLIFEQIFRDELGHLAFHADYLNRACSGLSGGLVFPRRPSGRIADWFLTKWRQSFSVPPMFYAPQDWPPRYDDVNEARDFFETHFHASPDPLVSGRPVRHRDGLEMGFE